MFKIGLLIDKIINSDSRKVEDTKKLRPASEGIVDCLRLRGWFTTSLPRLETKLNVDEFILKPFNLCLNL